MGENITITTEEYKKLMEAFVRIKIFTDFVNCSEYSIDRKDCGTILGFKVVEKED